MTQIISPKVDECKPYSGLVRNRYAYPMPREGQKSGLPKGLRQLVADKLRELMKAHVVTAQDIEDDTGISHQKVGRILKKKHSTNVDTLLAFAKYFRVDPDKFIAGEIPSEEEQEPPAGVKAHSVRAETPSKIDRTAKRNAHKKP